MIRLDVVSKGDLIIPEEILKQLPEGYLSVSVKTGKNVEELKQKIEELLLDLTDILNNNNSNSDENDSNSDNNNSNNNT